VTICFSATLPNAMQLAHWLNHASCFIAKDRPVKLSEYVCVGPQLQTANRAKQTPNHISSSSSSSSMDYIIPLSEVSSLLSSSKEAAITSTVPLTVKKNNSKSKHAIAPIVRTETMSEEHDRFIRLVLHNLSSSSSFSSSSSSSSSSNMMNTALTKQQPDIQNVLVFCGTKECCESDALAISRAKSQSNHASTAGRERESHCHATVLLII
jgi:superfamily II RNA helicase